MMGNTATQTGNPLVSIVIVHYNGVRVLEECLRSVFAQPYRPIEVIVVDNASVDESVAMVREKFREAIIVESKINIGFAGGNNLGVRSSQGDYVLLLNNDAILAKNSIPPLILSMKEENVAAVTSHVVTDDVPSRFYEMNGTVNFLGYNIMRHFKDMTKIFYAGGTALMFRKDVVGEPFPFQYFLYHEDVFLSWLLRLRGYDVRMEPKSSVYHRGNATTSREPSSLITYYQTRNRLLNLAVMYQGKTLVKLIPLVILDMFATVGSGVLVTSKSLKGVLKAYWWMISNLREIMLLRRKVQVQRKISDADILALMSCDVIDEARSPYGFAVVNVCSRLYARVVRLPFHIPDDKI